MSAIFGARTPWVLRLIGELSDLSAEDADTVAEAWRRTPATERAAAWAVMQDERDAEERSHSEYAALVARRRALSVSRMHGRPEPGFSSAAWDAAVAVAAVGQDADPASYEVLVSPLATRLPWLWRAGPASSEQPPRAGIPTQRAPSSRGVADEQLTSQGRGR